MTESQSDKGTAASSVSDDNGDMSEDHLNNLRKRAKKEPVNALEVSESLGYQTFRRKMRKIWTKEEDDLLRKLVNDSLVSLGFENGIKSIKTIQQSSDVVKQIPWDQLAKQFELDNKKATDVKKRWTSSLDPVLKKGKWTPEEDELLLKSYEHHGPQWFKISYVLENRTEDQCAKRYIEVLDPSTKDRLRSWDETEDLLLIAKVKKYGTKWRQISTEMDARPSLTCRNRWRKIITMVVRGIASETIKSAVQAGNMDVEGSGMDMLDKPNDTDTRGDVAEVHSRPESGTATPAPLPKSPTSDIKKEASTPMMFDMASRSNPTATLIDALKTGKVSVNDGQQPHQSNERSTATPEPTILNSIISPSPQFNNSSNSSLFVGNINRKESALPSPGAFLPLPAVETRKQQPETMIDWKFSLKESSGHTLSNGVISNLDLVKQLVNHAKSNNLKISIHQHIHNHYLAPRQTTPTPLLLQKQNQQQQQPNHHQQRQPNNIASNSQEFPTVRSPSFSDFETDFLSKTPNFNNWGLEDENHSPTGLDDKLQRFYHHHHHHHHDSQNEPLNQTPKLLQNSINGTSFAQTGLGQLPPHSASSNASYASPAAPEIREIGPSRHSHFNYLPSTFKPQLGSSENAKTVELSRSLNPSPNGTSGHRRKKSKRRTKNESKNSSCAGSTDNTPAEDADRNTAKNKVTPSTVSSVSIVDEEGYDFWETLRTLGGTINSGNDNESEEESPANPHLNDLFRDDDRTADTPTGYDSIFQFVEQKHTEDRQSTEEFLAEFAINPS
ncbi:unnamed protein product [Kluyveromyces dobzhanskii CBS 2104]|uniref:WGS project CCBQ000000000 data, contig 00015 n=1 Tax=Kluyveromyces dobzhanskii CBS 2104 TaxID=1427455 RepID=A0A0A8L9U2_9SACH|nr:unnamed protein product [Kluyveromyces dobzhanskii CBS 2104]